MFFSVGEFCFTLVHLDIEVLSLVTAFFHVEKGFHGKGPSINDVTPIFQFLTPLPPLVTSEEATYRIALQAYDQNIF